MATYIWRKVKSGTPSARVLSAYLALVLAVAVTGPGLAVYGSEGNALVAQPEELVVPADEVVEVEPVPVVETEPVIEPEPPAVPEPEVVPEPAVDEMQPAVAEPSVEIMNTASVVTPPAVLAPLALSSDPSGLGIVPTLVEGNPDLTAGGVRVNPPFTDAVAIPGYPGMFVTVSVTSTDDGQVFSFSSDVPVVRVVAKGGNVGANIYTYAPAVYGDTSLHAPVNPSGKYADLSHIDFYFGSIPDEPESGDLVVHKFHDLDEDGVYDDGEPMLEDWEFTLTQSTPPIVDVSAIALIGTGLTDAHGELLFSALEPGYYTVTETLKTGWANTTPLSQDVTVVDGQTVELWFGNIDTFVPFTELDLAITKTVDKTTAKPGELLTYTLTYWNTSDVVAYDFTITDDFDQRYITVVNAAGGTVADGKIVWSLAGPLAQADGKQTITYTARVIGTMPVGTTNIDNVVVIEHPDDSDPTNNTDRARTVVKIVRDEEPFLPFTGGEYLLLIGLAAVAATAGTVLRFRDRTAA